MSKKVVLVDVDSTLWDFGEEMFVRMRKMFPSKPIPEEFDTWEQPLQFFENKQDAHDMFTDIHSRQHSYGVFPFAGELLRTLKEKNYYILIASNRKNYTKISLRQWLQQHNLVYDEIYCDLDKNELFDQRKIDLVIDDSPTVQTAAIDLGIPVLTLWYKYNKDIKNTKKFENLEAMTKHLIEKKPEFGSFMWSIKQQFTSTMMNVIK